MKASVHWLNRYLAPGDLTPDQAEELLTSTSFPIDARDDLPGGDACLEVEVTSNRGDCLSHIGLAREIAARTGCQLMAPEVPSLPRQGRVEDLIRLENQVPRLCPRFTVQVIRGVKIGPSPAWLRQSLESVGQRSINNIVDVTNFINFELGHPCHAFDLNRLAGPALIVRHAKEGEKLMTLDGKQRSLSASDVVVADEQRAQSLAGIIGGGDSEVTDATTDVVLEVATWDPVAVRHASRRHQVRTDSSHRFERYVDPRMLDHAASRAAALMAEVSGGQLAEGMLDQGVEPAQLRIVEMRPERCCRLVGIHIPDDEMVRILTALGIGVSVPTRSQALRCTIPPYRPDLVREVDLIEEVARVHGFEQIPVHARMNVEVKHPQESELAIRELARILTGAGFYETVTFSFTSREHAEAFLPPEQEIIAVDDERRKQEPALRPSLLPGLLGCRRANQDAGVEVDGEMRLFELASTFAGDRRATSPVEGIAERRSLALLCDVPGVGKGRQADVDQRQRAVRIVRGVLEAAAESLAGAAIELLPAAPETRAYDPAAHAHIMLRGRRIGVLGLIAPEVQQRFDLDRPAAAAEVDLDALVEAYPPRRRIEPLAAFPGIERDLSLVVAEDVRWEQLRSLVGGAKLQHMEDVAFVGTYRGKQIGAGRKSVTLRMRFRAPDRTLRHEEVDPQVAAVVEMAGRELQATLRG